MLDSHWKYWVLPPAWAGIVMSTMAHDYMSITEAQKILFPQAKQFEEKNLILNDQELSQIKSLSGVRQKNAQIRIWKALNEKDFLGWFMVDDVVGKHEYITYAAALSPRQEVIGLEILTYRETHGEQVRNKDWRQQFAGKKLADPFKLDQDIRNISGATLSCRNVTDGVKRLLALMEVSLKKQ